MKKISCGIDFGTTNTSASMIDSAFLPELIPLEKNNQTIPTALFFAGSKVYFGREAMRLYMDGEEGRCMRSLKRILGTDLMGYGTIINKKFIQFDDILTCFFKHIKNKIDDFTKDNIENVVLGRPVHFIDNDSVGDTRAQKELEEIAIASGFKNIEFQYEPIAAAFAHERLIENEKLACVIDIGGGTSDFSIIKIGQNLIKKIDRTSDILANSGVRIGGNDFDKSLAMKSFMSALGYETRTNDNKPIPANSYWELSEWSKVNNLYSVKEINLIKKLLNQAQEPEKITRFLELLEQHQGHKFLSYVEKAKFDLTESTEAKTILDFISDCPTIYTTRKDFENSLSENINKIKKSLKECMKQAGLKSDDVELIILTGGSTEIPIIQKTMRDIFPKAKISEENKLSSVGLGLAYDSARKFGAK